jgi:catechol 2,3-dioxygenase-like lactoylglutathione lyase family enzyme
MAHLFETHLSVKDIDSSIAFYRDVVGLELAHVAPTRGAAFLWIGAGIRCWDCGRMEVRQTI